MSLHNSFLAGLFGLLIGTSVFAQVVSVWRQCGHPRYCAVSDRVVRQEPSLPDVSAGAGTVVTDATYGNRILRVTDGNTRPDRLGRTWDSPSSAESPAWNIDSTHFIVHGGGGEMLPYNWDGATFTATRMGDTGNPSGGSVLLLAGEGSFSFVRDNIVFGMQDAVRSKFVEYNIDTEVEVVLHDINDNIPGVPTHNISVSASVDDERVIAYVGGSNDTDDVVYIWDRTLGARWLNTTTGIVSGDFGPTGAYTGDTGWKIHNARISRNGNWARITSAASEQAGMYFWEISTLTLTPCETMGTPFCAGHVATGYNTFFNQPLIDTGYQWARRLMSDATNRTELISPDILPKEFGPDGHPSWSNVDAAETNPICMEVFESNNTIDHSWDAEIVCIRVDEVESRIWRFAHHRSSGIGFGGQPRSNLSQDGKYVLFTSDWEQTLTGGRNDAWIVELK